MAAARGRCSSPRGFAGAAGGHECPSVWAGPLSWLSIRGGAGQRGRPGDAVSAWQSAVSSPNGPATLGKSCRVWTRGRKQSWRLA